jgi:alpha-L-arabinofuranosidase
LLNRRQALGAIAAAGGALAAGRVPARARRDPAETVRIDPKPRFDLSPYLYMQFMEPLGATDGSVEAAWDHVKNDWRTDVVETTRQLEPTLMRWGGLFTDYYRWREGVGPRSEREPMANLQWGGIESNQVGTAEFVDFCRRVNADPLMCVNFESDGRERFMKHGQSIRTAGADEASDWVAYCNQSDHAGRIGHGHRDPLTIKLWQIGNETSYGRQSFDLETAAMKTVEFARAMRRADPSIKLIGWGDSGWARRMAEVAGEHLEYLAFHHMFNPDDRENPVLRNLEYRKDPDRTWARLMSACKIHERKVSRMCEQAKPTGLPLAMTECHFTIPGRDRCDVLSTWAAGVAYARLLHVNERYGHTLKIATAADFCGNRWQVNAVMIPTPRGRGKAFMMPVARVMSLYRHYSGDQSVKVNDTPADLDVTASRTGNRIYLHVANTRRTRSIEATLSVADAQIRSGTVHTITAGPETEITRFNPDDIQPSTRSLSDPERCLFPPASVSAVVLDLA